MSDNQTTIQPPQQQQQQQSGKEGEVVPTTLNTNSSTTTTSTVIPGSPSIGRSLNNASTIPTVSVTPTTTTTTTTTSSSSPSSSSLNINSSTAGVNGAAISNLTNVLSSSNLSSSLTSTTGSLVNSVSKETNNYHSEEYQFALENKKTLKRLLKISKHWTDSMKVYCQNSHSFSEELLKQSDQMIGFNQAKEKNLGNNLSYFGNTLKAVNSVHDQMLNEIQDVFCTPVANFVDYDFAEVVESHKKVQKSKEEYESTLGKISQSIKKSKTGIDETRLMTYEQELEKLKEVLECHNGELGIKLNELSYKNETKYLKSLLLFINAQYLFFNRASKLYANLKPRIEEIEQYLEEIQPPKVVEGHLLKKSKQVMGGWNKCWYVLKDGMLYCYKGKKEFHPENALNILLCSVRLPQVVLSSPGAPNPPAKEQLEYRFEILHPRKKQPIVLQAESEEERDRWVNAIQVAISNSLNSQSLEKSHSMTGSGIGKPLSNTSLSSQSGSIGSTDEVNQQVLRIVYKVPGNNVCADCSSTDPDWAVINLGIIICKVCSGVHRSLGTHISKVRSLTLDKWSPENINFMKEIGNQKFNQIYEHNLGEQTKPTDKSDRMTKENYIRAKYKNRDFIIKSSLSGEELAKTLTEMICNNGSPASTTPRDIMRFIKVLGQGSEVNHVDADGRTPLHHSLWRSDDVVVPELLLQNGADITLVDSRGWTPMHYAAFFNRPRCAHLLMRRGFEAIRVKCRDHLGRLAIDLATQNHSKEAAQVLRGEDVATGMTMDNIENGTVPVFEATKPTSTDFPREEILSEDEDDKYMPAEEIDSWSESDRGSVGRSSFSTTELQDQNGNVITLNMSNSSNNHREISNSNSSKESLTVPPTNTTSSSATTTTTATQDKTIATGDSKSSTNITPDTQGGKVDPKLNRPKSNRRPSLLGRGRNTLRLMKNKLNMSSKSTPTDGSGLANEDTTYDDQMSSDDEAQPNPSTSGAPGNDLEERKLNHRESVDSMYSRSSQSSRMQPTYSGAHSLPPSHSTSLNDLSEMSQQQPTNSSVASNSTEGDKLSPTKNVSPTPFKIFFKKVKGSISKNKKDKSATSPSSLGTDMSTESSQTEDQYSGDEKGGFDDTASVVSEYNSTSTKKDKEKEKKEKKSKKGKKLDESNSSGSANNSPLVTPNTNVQHSTNNSIPSTDI